ncbi:MAG TPA: HAMP domain-containing sensor histidine kinase [Nitriliruptoraceae bacterium]|nr:HAMP domain-containing sensor histidine kinase [Nitriliruptoraceae bacterium]
MSRRRGRVAVAMMAGLALLVAVGLVVSEGGMRSEPQVRARLYVVFALAAIISAVATLTLVRMHRRWSSLRLTMVVIAGIAIVIASGVVMASTTSMILDTTGIKLVLAALVLGAGLGLLVALSVARPLIADLQDIAAAAQQIASGDLTARTGVDRRDEVGELSRWVDQMAARLEALEHDRARDASARDHLLTALSHDLRTPLASMQAAVEALQDGVAPDPARYLAAMATDVTVLRNMVDDLFVLVRLEAGDQVLDLMRVDLVEIVDAEVETMTPVALAQGVDVHLACDGALPVDGDPQALGRVLRNLIDNAIRYAPADSRVQVATAADAGWAVVSVTDSGQGFPPEFVERAFERFSRADQARERDSGGAGMGLAIARELVLAHGGEIRVDPDTTTTVRVRLPLRG